MATEEKLGKLKLEDNGDVEMADGNQLGVFKKLDLSRKPRSNSLPF